MAYQPGQPDAFYHQYLYDAENRIINVLTSHDSLDWDNDAYYQYYKHGPLARSVIGQQQVQGVDYLYTLQGWLKAVNPTTLLLGGANGNGSSCGSGTAVNDLVVDARVPPTPPTYTARRSISFEDGFEAGIGTDTMWAHIDSTLTTCTSTQPTADPDDSGTYVARNAYHFVLDYNDSDYTPIGTGLTSPTLLTASQLGSDSRPLYNGNITSMGVSIEKLAQASACAGMLYNYQYDQLNRLVAMDAWQSTKAWDTLTKVSDYQERINYDPNGNILRYLRNGTTANSNPLAMDSLKYNYIPGTNQLRYVHDSVPSGNYSVDIDNQDTLNYTYDQIGNLTRDLQASIDSINWTVYGKIDSIHKTTGTSIKYTYDATGNRISKTIHTSGGHLLATYYVRDASGNIMSVYESGKDSINSGDLTQTEVDLYGSSRLGTWAPKIDVQNIALPIGVYLPGLVDSGYFVNTDRREKQYEFINHVGNTLVTVSDSKKQFSTDGTTIDHYEADVETAQDYSVGGMEEPGRTYTNGEHFPYGFNNQEKSDEIANGTYTAEFWEYDSRIVRRWNIDPKQNIWESPYLCFSGNPIFYTDLLGDEADIVGGPGDPGTKKGPTSKQAQGQVSNVVQFSHVSYKLPSMNVSDATHLPAPISRPQPVLSPKPSVTSPTNDLANTKINIEQPKGLSWQNGGGASPLPKTVLSRNAPNGSLGPKLETADNIVEGTQKAAQAMGKNGLAGTLGAIGDGITLLKVGNDLSNGDGKSAIETGVGFAFSKAAPELFYPVQVAVALSNTDYAKINELSLAKETSNMLGMRVVIDEQNGWSSQSDEKAAKEADEQLHTLESQWNSTHSKEQR